LKSCAGSSGTTVRPAEVAADVHALAGRQPVGLDDVRRRRRREVRGAPVGVVEHLGRGGRDTGLAHHLLGEALAALQARRRCRRTEAGAARGAQGVGDAGDQGHLRADDDQVCPDVLGQGHDRVGVGHVDRPLLGERDRAGVAGRADERRDGGVARQRPQQGVLARTGAEHEDVHGPDASAACDLSGRGPRAASPPSVRRP
jgi:hypothetical protein